MGITNLRLAKSWNHYDSEAILCLALYKHDSELLFGRAERYAYYKEGLSKLFRLAAQQFFIF